MKVFNNNCLHGGFNVWYFQKIENSKKSDNLNDTTTKWFNGQKVKLNLVQVHQALVETRQEDQKPNMV